MVSKVRITLISVALTSFAVAAQAQSTSSASPTMTLTVPQVASINISNFTVGSAANPGSFDSSLEGSVTLNYTVRVPKGGSPNAKITVQSATSTLATGTAGSTAPGVTSVQYSASASGTGVTANSSWQSLSPSTAGTLVTFAAGTKVNSGTATVNVKVSDSSTYDADTYTLPLTFTISAQ
jgi:hypothetical protein